MSRKTICIDARFWGVKHTGIGRYVENLIDNLPADPSVEVVLIVHPDQMTEPKLARFTKYPARHHPYTFASLLEMGWWLLLIRPDLLHVPHITLPWFWPGKMVMTVHDLIKHYSPGAAASTHGPVGYWLKYAQYRVMVWAAFRRAAHILVPANYWKQELVNKYRLTADKVTVTYEGVSPLFFSPSVVEIDLPDHRPYVLYVGNIYQHKNIPTLMAAIRQLNGTVLLIIVCARSVFTDRLEKLISQQGLSKWVKFWGAVDDETLASLYRHCLALVFPSLIEGFGLPGLEAMAAGTVVIAADATCLPEVYGPAALYFEPTNVQDLVKKIRRVLVDNKLRASLIAAGKKQVKKYSWAKMARQTWQIYQKVLKK